MNQINHFPPKSRLAAYLRDSGGADQDLSTEQQDTHIRKWCLEHGYVLSEVFRDSARSGSSTVGRDAFDRMITHFRSPDCTEAGIIVWKYDRISRDFDDSAFFKADIRRRG